MVRSQPSLLVAADEKVSTWLEDRFLNKSEAASKEEVYAKLKTGIPVMDGRYRSCASQQGNALHSVITLGLEDERSSPDISPKPDTFTVLTEALVP
jgi:hypothetical protein